VALYRCTFVFVDTCSLVLREERREGRGTYEECRTELRYSSANLWSAVSPEAFRQVIDQKFVPNMIIVYSSLRYVMVLVAFYRSGIVGRFPDSTVRYYGTYGIPRSKIILVGTDLF
jgi:hypothetical protein